MRSTFPFKWGKESDSVEQPIETEEDETGIIELASAVPVDKNTIDSETYLSFQDKESEFYYYIHYVDSKADEAYVNSIPFIDREFCDDTCAFYATIDSLFEADEKGEIDSLCIISAEDFASVKASYQDQIINFCKNYETSVPEKTVNRVAKVLKSIFLIILFVCISVGISILPVNRQEGGNYISILFTFCLVFLIAIIASKFPRIWLMRRIKWLLPNDKNIITEKLNGKPKSYYAEAPESNITFEYHPWEKLMTITKEIQIPLANSTQEHERLNRNFKDWAADKSFIEHYYMSDMNSFGVCHYYFAIPKAEAKKATMKKLREWISMPEHDASKVCEHFKFEDEEGTFYIKFQDCKINMITHIRKNGEKETFDPKINTLQDDNLSAEIKCFYIDFDYYVPKLKKIRYHVDA